MTRILAAIAFLTFAGFLAILIWHVPSPDLVIIVTAVICLAGWDFFRAFRKP